MDAKWIKSHSTIYHSLVGTAFRDDAELVEYIQRIHSLRVKYGFMPKEA
jgi:methyl-coenzyme M reductase gamma subunit